MTGRTTGHTGRGGANLPLGRWLAHYGIRKTKGPLPCLESILHDLLKGTFVLEELSSYVCSTVHGEVAGD